MTPAMVATARALMACPDCPEGLAMHVVSEAVVEQQCGECGTLWVSPRSYCSKCHSRPPRMVEVTPADEVPDLTSAKNGGVLLEALWKAAPDATPSRNKGGTVRMRWGFDDDGVHADCIGWTLAHAAALALLAVRS